MCIGDSSTEGSGATDIAKDSYPAQLQRMLDKDKYEVKNYGVPVATAMKKGEKPY